MDLFKLVFVFIHNHTLRCRPVTYYYLHREDKRSTAFKWALCDEHILLEHRCIVCLRKLCYDRFWSFGFNTTDSCAVISPYIINKSLIHLKRSYLDLNFTLKFQKSVTRLYLVLSVLVMTLHRLTITYWYNISPYWFHPTSTISHESCFITPTSPLSSRVRVACLSRLGLFIGCIPVSPKRMRTEFHFLIIRVCLSCQIHEKCHIRLTYGKQKMKTAPKKQLHINIRCPCTKLNNEFMHTTLPWRLSFTNENIQIFCFRRWNAYFLLASINKIKILLCVWPVIHVPDPSFST